MIDQNTWKFINTFAPWLAAIGTISAVITSLYLARRDNKISLSVNGSLMKSFVQGGGPGHDEEFVFITVTNVHRRPATITNIYYRIGFLKRQTYVILPMQDPYSSRIPTKLTDGDEATFRFPMANFDTNFTKVAEDYLHGIGLYLKSLFIRVGAVTSTGAQFESRINKSLRDKFLARAREVKGKGNTHKLDGKMI